MTDVSADPGHDKASESISYAVARLRPLPEPLTTVEAPDKFSPSHLHLAEICLLRTILGSIRAVPALPAPPEADRGSAFHLLLERAVRGEIERRGSAEEDAKRELEDIVAKASAKFAGRFPSGSQIDLKSVWPPAEWRRKARVTLDAAVRYLNAIGPGQGNAKPTSARKSAVGGLDFDHLPSAGTWAEVRLYVPELRMAGRADLVTKKPGLVVIGDLKTGRAVDGQGAIRDHIVLQLRLYGLMVRRLAPGTQIRLLVDDGTEHEVDFSEADADALESWLHSVLAAVPAGMPLPAEPLASFGPACDGCGFRHTCPAYRRSAPAAWSSVQSFRLPLDVWGIVESVEATSSGATRVEIRDDAARLATVTGLHPSRVEGISSGDRLYLFGLKTRDRVGSPEAWRHPRNFFESLPEDPYSRAWAIAAYAAKARAEASSPV